MKFYFILLDNSFSNSSVNDSSDSDTFCDEANWYDSPQAALGGVMTASIMHHVPQLIESPLADDNLSFFGHKQILDGLEENSPKGNDIQEELFIVFALFD